MVQKKEEVEELRGGLNSIELNLTPARLMAVHSGEACAPHLHTHRHTARIEC